MAKAVLVMDMSEQVCQKCTLCYGTKNDDEYLCCAVGKLVPDGKKPDWCPLRELPEKKVADKQLAISPLTEGYLKDFEKGWNACRDVIENK